MGVSMKLIVKKIGSFIDKWSLDKLLPHRPGFIRIVCVSECGCIYISLSLTIAKGVSRCVCDSKRFALCLLHTLCWLESVRFFGRFAIIFVCFAKKSCIFVAFQVFAHTYTHTHTHSTTYSNCLFLFFFSLCLL